MRYEQYFWS